MKRNARRVKTPCGFVIISPHPAGGLKAGSQPVPGIDEIFLYAQRIDQQSDWQRIQDPAHCKENTEMQQEIHALEQKQTAHDEEGQQLVFRLVL